MGSLQNPAAPVWSWTLPDSVCCEIVANTGCSWQRQNRTIQGDAYNAPQLWRFFIFFYSSPTL